MVKKIEKFSGHLKKKLYKHFRDIYDPRIRLDLFFRWCDLFQENVKELIDIS